MYFKHLGKTDGLSQISVISICQDELGRMWFGTLEGLSCYDGNSMTVYKPSQDSVRSFLGNNVDNLVSDKQGNLFFISDYALVRYDLIIRKTRRSRFQNEAFRFLGLFPKRSVSFFTKFERHSDGLPIQFECRFFIAFCGEKVSARIAGLAFFLYLYIVVRMGHYSLLSYVE